MENSMRLFAFAKIFKPLGLAAWLINPALALISGVYPASAWSAPLTLEQAWQLAERANPTLRSAQANLIALEGQSLDAHAPLWNNPELSTGIARRRTTDAKGNDWSIGIAQRLEIGGQATHRREAARQEWAAAKEGVQGTRRQIRGEVEQRFYKIVALQTRIDGEQKTLKLTEDSAFIVKKRFKAGEDSRLDNNLALVESERARNQLTLFNEQLLQARAELAATLQLPVGNLPDVAGDLALKQPGYTLPELLATVESRPQLKALGYRERAARSRLGLERASVYPDLTIGLSTAREGPNGAQDKIIGLNLSLPLPLFKRNATGIGRAYADLTQTQIEREAMLRDARAQVATLWQTLESLRNRVNRLQNEVLPRLDENQRLSQKALRVGEIGFAQLLLVNRQILDARRDLLDAMIESTQTRIALEQASGWPAALTGLAKP